jgi:hypothetical protein
MLHIKQDLFVSRQQILEVEVAMIAVAQMLNVHGWLVLCFFVFCVTLFVQLVSRCLIHGLDVCFTVSFFCFVLGVCVSDHYLY